MKTSTKIILVVLAFVVLYACTPTAEDTVTPEGAQDYAKAFLPSSSKNVKSLGNEWVLFDLEVNGRTRTFLYQPYYNSVSRSPTGALTEISE